MTRNLEVPGSILCEDIWEIVANFLGDSRPSVYPDARVRRVPGR